MKVISTTVLTLIIYCYSIAQISVDWQKNTDSKFKEIMNSGEKRVDSIAVEAFRQIIIKRQKFKFKYRVDTTRANLILISELYNRKTKEFDFYESYYNSTDNSNIYRIYSFWNGNWQNASLRPSEIDNLTWTYSLIDTIYPREYEFWGGCSPNFWKNYKIKRCERKLKRNGQIIEDYYIIDNWIDKNRNIVNISFRIPVSGERTLDASYGAIGNMKKPELKLWWRY